MALEKPGPEELTKPQRDRIERRRVDQDRTLEAMHQLEGALASAAPRREAQWQKTVLGALRVLGEVMAEEAANAEQPDSLLSDLIR